MKTPHHPKDGRWHWYSSWWPRWLRGDHLSLGGASIGYPNQRRWVVINSLFGDFSEWEYRKATNLLDENGEYVE